MPNHEVLEADRKDADSISLLQRVVAASSGAFITSLMSSSFPLSSLYLAFECFVYLSIAKLFRHTLR